MEHVGIANKLASIALVVNDIMSAEAEGLSATAVAALITIRAREPLSIGEIARIVGLTHSATVRLVDRLERDWLVRRTERRGREVLVATTARGKRKAAQLANRRVGAVGSFVDRLSTEEGSALEQLLDRLLKVAVEEGVPVERICRMTDREASEAMFSGRAPAYDRIGRA